LFCGVLELSYVHCYICWVVLKIEALWTKRVVCACALVIG